MHLTFPSRTCRGREAGSARASRLGAVVVSLSLFIARLSRHPGRRLRILLVLLPLALAGCDRLDPDQAALCRSLIHAFEANAPAADAITAEADPERAERVLVRYRIGADERRIACDFMAGGMARDRLVLAAVESPDGRRLEGLKLHMLRVWLGMRPLTTASAAPAAPDGDWLGRQAAYAVQQAVNGLSVAAVYALLAVGFTMIYAVLGKMFLAFGQVMMVGAFGALIAGSLLSGAALPTWVVLPGALAGAIALGAVLSVSAGRLLGTVLHAPGTQAALVASVGLAIALQEGVRLVQGTREVWLHPPFPGRVPLFVAGGFDVSVGIATLVIAAIAAAMFALIAVLLRTGFGRAYRACTDDIGMAALLGVRVPAVTGFVMLVGGMSAGCAGAVAALHYGGVSFFTGTLIGLKALTAAIVGGIGSVGGAVIGALLIAVVETVSVGYLSPAFKDISVFAVLVAALIWRPQGIAGRKPGRGD
jgi:branched-chain amino acid transport system permease protein